MISKVKIILLFW